MIRSGAKEGRHVPQSVQWYVRLGGCLDPLEYIDDFDQAVAASSSGQEVVSRMTTKYPDLGNQYTLWLAAYTQPLGA
jgi:hypothetical protein